MQMQSDATVETVTRAGCPVCAGKTVQKGRHVSTHNNINYSRLRCLNCRLEHWDPLKTDLSIYEDDGFEAYRDYHSGQRAFPRWAEPLFEDVSTGLGSALDIGCGDGSVLARLQQYGLKVRGIDLDEKSIRIARERCGQESCSVSTLATFADNCQRDGTRFGLVTFFEVLEHQVDPAGFLAHVRTLMTDDGEAAGSVPNRNRFLAPLDRKLGEGDYPPHHHLWFSETALRRVLELSGFIDIDVQKTGAIGYGELRRKLRHALQQRAQGLPALLRLPARAGIPAFAAVAAVVPWIGRRIMPSHLFFRCRHPGSTQLRLDGTGSAGQ